MAAAAVAVSTALGPLSGGLSNWAGAAGGGGGMLPWRTWLFPALGQRTKVGLTLGPLGGGPAMQPHHHGGEGHLALHTVLPDGIDDSSWEVDVEVTEEDDAVRVLGTDRGGSGDPTHQGSEVRPLPRLIPRLLPV